MDPTSPEPTRPSTVSSPLRSACGQIPNPYRSQVRRLPPSGCSRPACSTLPPPASAPAARSPHLHSRLGSAVPLHPGLISPLTEAVAPAVVLLDDPAVVPRQASPSLRLRPP